VYEWRALNKGDGIDVLIDVTGGPSELLVDPDQVKEALVNLMVNASEAMPAGGTLRLLAEEIQANGGPAVIELRVVDTGTGISTDHLQHIYDPFFTTKEYGTGLGLTNAKRLVENNGGQMLIHSVERQGTEVELRFPAVVRAGRQKEEVCLNRPS